MNIDKTMGFLIFGGIALAVAYLLVQPNNAAKDTMNIATDCDNVVFFGDVDICLPIIDGMTECYSTPSVKARADKSNYKGNSILAYYVNNTTYNQLNKIDEIEFDDYFQIFATNAYKRMRVGQAELNRFGEMIEREYGGANINDIKQKFDNIFDDLSSGEIVLIESYSPNIKAKTFVMLVKMEIENVEMDLITTLNYIQIKDRLIYLTYYKYYNGEESIMNIKSKNDYIVLQLLDENK